MRNRNLPDTSAYTNLYFHQPGPAKVIVQGSSEYGDEEQVDNGEPGKATYQDSGNRGSFAIQPHHFGIGEPFARRAGKNGFEQKIIDEQDPEKEPAEMIVRVAPELYIPVPPLETEISDRKDDRGIDQEIQCPGTVANCSHEAKIGSGE